jgi:hypothetical protein
MKACRPWRKKKHELTKQCGGQLIVIRTSGKQKGRWSIQRVDRPHPYRVQATGSAKTIQTAKRSAMSALTRSSRR